MNLFLIVTFVNFIFVLASIYLTLFKIKGFPPKIHQQYILAMIFIFFWSLFTNLARFVDSKWTAFILLKLSLISVLISFVFLVLFQLIHELHHSKYRLRISIFTILMGISIGLLATDEFYKIKRIDEKYWALDISGTPQLILMPLIFYVGYIFYTTTGSYSNIETKNKGEKDLPRQIRIMAFISLPFILLLQYLLSDNGILLFFIGSILIFVITYFYSVIPFSAIFHHQKLYSLYCLYPGGMPAFRYEFIKEEREFADIMVSGALYSGIIMLKNLLTHETKINRIEMHSRSLILGKTQNLYFALMSDHYSPVLELQLSEFISQLERFDLINELDDFNYDLTGVILNNIRDIFYANVNPSKEHLFTYPSYIEEDTN